MLMAIMDTMDSMVMAEDTTHMVVLVVTKGDTTSMHWYRASSP